MRLTQTEKSKESSTDLLEWQEDEAFLTLDLGDEDFDICKQTPVSPPFLASWSVNNSALPNII